LNGHSERASLLKKATKLTPIEKQLPLLVSERGKKRKREKIKRRMEEFCGEPLLSLSSSWHTSSPRLSQCLSRTVSKPIYLIFNRSII